MILDKVSVEKKPGNCWKYEIKVSFQKIYFVKEKRFGIGITELTLRIMPLADTRGEYRSFNRTDQLRKMREDFISKLTNY